MLTLTHICPTSFGFPCGFADAAGLIGSHSLICTARPPHLFPPLSLWLREPSNQHPGSESDSRSRPPEPAPRCSRREGDPTQAHTDEQGRSGPSLVLCGRTLSAEGATVGGG